MDLSVGADFCVAVFGSPLCDVGVESFPVLHHRREQPKIAAFLPFRLQTASDLVARLGLGRHLAIRTKLSAEPREQESQEVVNLGDGGHRALAATAGIALLNADRRRNTRDEV